MVSVLTSSMADCGFKSYLIKSKVSMHASLRSKSKDWLARNLDNVSVWSDMSTCGLLFQ